MKQSSRLTLFFTVACVVTCFAVFVAPFFHPAAFTSTISVSNDAGFNNRLAAVATALCAVAVFSISMLAPQASGGLPSWKDASDLRALPWRVWGGAALLVGGVVSVAGWLVAISDIRYDADVGYFVNQMSSYAFSHRQLYAQIEFPYGPLLFYPPILLHKLLGHVSLRACFLMTLVVNQIVGVLLLGYLVNQLPMSRRWKIFALCCYVPFTLEPGMGVNFTLFRFTIPLAMLVFSVRQKSMQRTAILFGLGTILGLAVSPEVGFAFGAGAVMYAMLQVRLEGKAWLLAAVVVPVAAGLFLLVAGRPYLLMLSLFAGGMYNLIVEPLPHILLFLMAAVWLVPRMIAAQIKSERDGTALLVSLFVVSMALVPVAFGRADPVHVFFDGIGVFLLSFAAMSVRPRWQQLTWGACVAASMLLGYAAAFRLSQFQFQVRDVIYEDATRHPTSLPTRVLVRMLERVRPSALKTYQDSANSFPARFDVDALQSIVGGDTVATPYLIPLAVEEQLRSRGLYRPDFYFYMTAVIESSAERRKIEEFNEALWAMLPAGVEYKATETQEYADLVMGIALPYKAKRTPYVAGERFTENLHRSWRAVGTVDQFIVYCNTLRNPRCERH